MKRSTDQEQLPLIHSLLLIVPKRKDAPPYIGPHGEAAGSGRSPKEPGLGAWGRGRGRAEAWAGAFIVVFIGMTGEVG